MKPTDNMNSFSEANAKLRQQAEDIVQENVVQPPDALEMSPEEAGKILHELRVHRIELKIQNEELRRAQTELSIVKEQFFDLYDQAPVGYITVNEKGLILEANLTASTLLGMVRGALVAQPISRFILPEDQDIYYEGRKRLFSDYEAYPDQAHGPLSFELRMISGHEDVPIWVNMVATLASQPDGMVVCRIILNDITERKRHGDYISVLGEMLNEAPASITIHNVEGRFLYANQVAAYLHGYETIADYMDVNLQDVDVPETAELINDRIKKISEKGEARFEVVHFRKDGSIFPLEVHAKKIEWEGRPAILSIATDITERKKSEEMLRKSEEKFRTVASFIYNWEYWIDGDGSLVYVSPSCERITTYTDKEFYQDPGLLTRIIHPDDRESFMQHTDGNTKGKKKEDCQAQDFRILTRNGEERWIAHVCRDVFDREGKPTGRRVSNREISRQKQAEMKLIENVQRLQLATASGKLAVWDWNVKDNIMFWDDRMFELYGITRDTFSSNADAWMNSLHPDDKQRAIDECNAALLGEKAFDTTFRVLRPDGTIKHIKAAAMVTSDKNGKAIRMIGINSDITAQIQVEEEKQNLEAHHQQAQKMEALGTLAGGIAHDFNNILGAILGYAEMAYEDSLSGSVNPNDLNQVVQASHRAKDLVKQILAFSRQAESQKVPMHPAPMVKESIKLLRSSIPTTIDIQQDIDPETNLILADPTQIHQIMMNLCTNAYHAMEETCGTLSISLKNKVLALQDLVGVPDVQPGHFVQLTIRDTGSGIAPEIQARIFEPYFTTKEAGKGTGMGLSIVHGIVRNTGGFLTCHSEMGAGTVFEICLPAVLEQVVPESRESEMIPVGTERILFIDDEEILAEMGQYMLEKLGYQVTVKTNSIEALTTFLQQPDAFDLVITDQTMPGMTGSDLAQRMLQIRPTLPIILCTGYSSQIPDDKAKSYGTKGFALKPLSRKDIALLVRKVLDGEDKRDG